MDDIRSIGQSLAGVISLEELREARKAISFGLTISVVWLLLAGAITEELRTKRLVEEMGVWVLLSETLSRAFTEDRKAVGIYGYEGTFSDVPMGGRVADYRKAVFDNRGNEGFEVRRLAIAPPWSPGAVVPFALKRVEAPEGLEIFAIVSEDKLVNSAKYSVGVLRHDAPVVHSRVPASITEVRSYYDALFLEGGLRGPNSADAVFSYLASKGWKGRTEADLNSRDPVVAEAITDVRQQRHTIASLPLTASLLPPAVGMLLALSAFNLVGPTIRIRNLRADISDASWTFAIRPTGASKFYLIVLQLLAALICIGLFAWVALSILGFGALLAAEGEVLLYLGAIGACSLVGMAILFFWTVFSRIRH